MSQPKKVTFGSATVSEMWTHVSYRKYGKRHLSIIAESPTPFELVVNSAIAERKVVEHPTIEEEVDKEGSELGALTGAISVIKSLAEHEESNLDKNCAARGSIVADVIPPGELDSSGRTSPGRAPFGWGESVIIRPGGPPLCGAGS